MILRSELSSGSHCWIPQCRGASVITRVSVHTISWPLSQGLPVSSSEIQCNIFNPTLCRTSEVLGIPHHHVECFSDVTIFKYWIPTWLVGGWYGASRMDPRWLCTAYGKGPRKWAGLWFLTAEWYLIPLMGRRGREMSRHMPRSRLPCASSKSCFVQKARQLHPARIIHFKGHNFSFNAHRVSTRVNCFQASVYSVHPRRIGTFPTT